MYQGHQADLAVHHAQGSLVIPYHRADLDYRVVLSLPLQQWVLELHRGHHEGLQVRHLQDHQEGLRYLDFRILPLTLGIQEHQASQHLPSDQMHQGARCHLGIQEYQDLLSVQGNQAGQEIQGCLSLP